MIQSKNPTLTHIESSLTKFNAVPELKWIETTRSLSCKTRKIIHYNTNLRRTIMKIAVPVTTTNDIDAHFGHCESYSIFSISDEGSILSIEKLASPQGCGCKSNIAEVLATNGVTIMLAGGIGQGAINVLANAGINVIRGCSGQANDVIEKYIKGTLVDSGSTCEHHEHHSCNH